MTKVLITVIVVLPSSSSVGSKSKNRAQIDSSTKIVK